jgi:VanZ family protein
MDMNMDIGTVGEIKTGTTIGHVLASSFFLGIGGWYLLLNLHRAKNLRPGQSFCDLYVPERDPNVYRIFALAVGFATVVGAMSEGMGGVVTFRDFFFQLLHEALYLSFGFAGLVAYLESKRRVPMDSTRVAMVIALLLFYIMMSAHAAMKPGSIDGSLHTMLAKTCLVNALVGMYSIWNPKSVFAFVLNCTLPVMIGVWMTTLGFYVCCFDVPLHWVETIFCLQLLGVFTVMLIIVVIVLPPRDESEWQAGPGAIEEERYKYNTLSAMEDAREDDTWHNDESSEHLMTEGI